MYMYTVILLLFASASYFISLASIANQMILCGTLVDGKWRPL
jgi:hypothetical protein